MMKEQLKIAVVTCLAWLIRMCLSLRYRIRVIGLDQIVKQHQKESGGILFLPNHPAEIDPVFLTVVLWNHFHPRPLIVENFYYLKGFHFFISSVKALPMPTMDSLINTWKAKRIEKLMKQIVEGRKKGENFLVYPSGKLMREGKETIGGASFAHNLLNMDPEAKVVLVRTTGLWGSQFSRAITGKSPDFGKVFLDGMKILLKNFLFFTPRREVQIEFSFAPSNLPIRAQRMDFNRALEEWYNQTPEPLSLVSFSFWKKKIPIPAAGQEKEGVVEQVQVPPELEKEILHQLSQIARRPVEEIRKEMNPSKDLGLDSLDITQLYLFLDERYHIGEVSPSEVQTVEDIIQVAAGAKGKKEEKEEEIKEKIFWKEESSRLPPTLPLGNSLGEAFLLMCDRMGKSYASIDAVSGLLSYQKMKQAALVLSERIQKMPGDKVGIMLPSSSGAYIVILATLFAKKIPVMMNWTAGTRALEHSAKVTDLKTIISSSRFLGRRELGDFGCVDDLILLLEDIRISLTLTEKLKGVLYSLQSGKSLVKTLSLDQISKDDCAVILFTSGTEALPKGVPLSHNNLLSNQRAAVSLITLTEKDLLYGVLPPFHSFGFSVTGLLPLLSGFRAAFAPDPTDSHGLAFDIENWKPTMFFCAPSFIKALFRVAKPENLTSVRLFVTGAEKAPEELFEYVNRLGPGHEMLEGYGITECAPIVSLVRPGQERKGVGKPLPGVEICVIDSEKQTKLPVKQEGEICICGPNVFHGYLGDHPSPFLELDGKKWYRSGDRGILDEEGNLHLSGRLKRFVKIGGEMISLGGLEEEIFKLVKEKNWATLPEGPAFAIAVREKESEKPLIILISTVDLNKEAINTALKEKGYSSLVKIAEVKKVDQIPLTGTGKTHYRLLDEMIQ
jgi:long-chain-fatty-acid--[acyl-carrier-protein] ligase